MTDQDKRTGAPSRYVQGPGALRRLGRYTRRLGQGIFLISDEAGIERIRQDVEAGLPGAGGVEFVPFERACCEKEITELVRRFEASGCQVVAGAGGGKHLDVAKAVAAFAGAPMVMLPTVASTDAPCSALAVLYTPDGLFDRYLYLDKNPDLVLADTTHIAAAPARLLAAGMGDALSTWFEARACAEAGGKNSFGTAPGAAALCLAQGCWNNLLRCGAKAMEQVQRKCPGEELETIVETNIYLSGVGFESGGLAAAHAVANGIASLGRANRAGHGQAVAFGVQVQLVLEQRLGAQPLRARQDLSQVRAFCKAGGAAHQPCGSGAFRHHRRRAFRAGPGGAGPGGQHGQHALRCDRRGSDQRGEGADTGGIRPVFENRREVTWSSGSFHTGSGPACAGWFWWQGAAYPCGRRRGQPKQQTGRKQQDDGRGVQPQRLRQPEDGSALRAGHPPPAAPVHSGR